MYLIAAIKMAVCLVEIIDDDVSQNHCVSITALQSKLSQVAICLNIFDQDCRYMSSYVIITTFILNSYLTPYLKTIRTY